MADTTALKNRIRAAIKANDNQEITGPVLQQALLDMVDELNGATETEADARQSGDSTLQQAINSEADARQSGDSILQQAINSEADARQSGDSTLRQAINSEADARQSGDSTLQQAINSEADARQSADTQLNNLITSIKNNIDNGYVYAGIATTSSTPTTGKVFYLALTAGTYTNFGATIVPQGINILKYNGTTWLLDSFLGLDDAPTQGSNNLVKSGGVLDSIIKDGSAFDLSAYNNGTTYADLSAALTALNALPAAYKKGGMSIKFVQSSDNKYVQARCMAQNFTTDVTQWQGVDDEPVVDSHNLVESGGVAAKLKKIEDVTRNEATDEDEKFIIASNNYNEETDVDEEKYLECDDEGLKVHSIKGFDGNRLPSNRLVIKEGRIYKSTIVKTGGDATINNSCASINNVQSYVIHNTSWAQIKITGFNHKVGERVGLYVYIDYSQMNKPAEQMGNMSVLTIRFRNGNTNLQSIQYSGLYELANGWNLLQSSVLNQECDSIILEPYTESEVSFVVEAVIVGRKTKPVLTFSFDGLYQKSLDSGAYALHRQLGIPITLMGAQQYNWTDSFITYCKGLQRDGIAEFGWYSSLVREQSTFSDALTLIEQQIYAYKKLCPNELIVVGCQHNNNSALVENACLKEGFKIFRTADLLTNDIRDVVGLRHIHSYGSYITSGWTLENQTQAIADAKAYIDALITNGDWGDIMAHQIVLFENIDSADYGLAQTYEYWEAVLQYAKSKKDLGLLDIMTIGQLYKTLNNIAL